MMDQTPAPGFRRGDRHGWISTLCERLEKVAHGRAAEEMLAAGVDPGRRAIVALPMWAWVPGGPAEGRKAVSADGGNLLLPLRVHWSSPSLLVDVPAAQSTTFAWTAVGRGRSLRGDTSTIPGLVSSAVPDDFPPETIVVRSQGQRPRRAALQRIAKDGKDAWWQIVLSLEGWVGSELKNANSKVSQELAESGSQTAIVPASNGRVVALSEQSLETLATEMLFGSDDRPGSVPRLIEKCLAESFARVDPLHFVRVWLSRDAEEVVRVGMGDLKFGSKVRRLLASSGARSPEELLALYREHYPHDGLGIDRLERALMVGADPMAGYVSVDLSEWRGDGWEAVAHALDDLSTLDAEAFASTEGSPTTDGPAPGAEALPELVEDAA